MLRFLRNSSSRLGALSRRTFATSNQPLGPVVPSESALGIAAVINRKARVANEFADLRTNTEDLALGLEKYTVGDLLLTKSLEDRGTWLWCDENVPALEAVRTMTKANVGALLVMRSSVLDVDNDGVVSAEELVRGRWEDAVAGVLTERDYLRKVVAQNKDASRTAVGTIMTDKKLYDVAQTDTPVLEALRRMTEGRHRHMPVVNANRTMAGMLCIGDVTRMVVDAHREEVLRLRDYLAGASY